MLRKIFTLGDTHGTTAWKDLLFNDVYEYEIWRAAVAEGAPIDSDSWSNLPISEYDLVIFIGDYVDSFNFTNVEIKKNLEDIIHLKKTYPDKVVLLLGNHDVQYFIKEEQCSGYRPAMQFDLEKLYVENLGLFKIAHLEEGKDRNILWTHAGVSKEWYSELHEEMFDSNHRFH